MALPSDPKGKIGINPAFLLRPSPDRAPVDVATIGDLTMLKHVQIDNLIEAMSEQAWKYLPVSYLIGKQKAKDLGHPMSTSAREDEEAIGRALNENKAFLETSLRPAMQIEMATAHTPEEVEAIFEKFTGRAESYGDYLWSVYQNGYQGNLDPEVLLEFFGPSDARSCQTCMDRVAGNPYPASQAPTPGDGCECRGNCRHDLVPHGAIPRY